MDNMECNMSNGAQKLFPQGIGGVIFDCDGVMIDSEEANRFFYNSILAALNLPPMTPEQEAYAFMATSIQALSKMTPEKDHGKLEDLIRTAVNYDRDVLPRTKLMPGFMDFIEKCHAAGLLQAIDTNRTDIGIARILDFFSLPNYFNPVISCSVEPPKPSPDGALAICRAWNTQPSQVLFVGDSDDDRQAAKGAGCIFAAFGGKGLAGDIDAKNFASLWEQIRRVPRASGIPK